MPKKNISQTANNNRKLKKMKKTFQNYVAMALLALASTSPTACAQEKNTVTVRGKIVDAQTGKPPYALVAINEKDNWETIGSNHHVLMNTKNGKFSIQIPKGASLSINAGIPYKTMKFENIAKDSFLNIELEYISGVKKPIKHNSEILKIRPQKYTVKGKIIDSETKKPLQMVTVGERWGYNEKGHNRHTVTDKNGNYSFTIHKGNSIDFDGMGYNNRIVSDIRSDQTINISLQKIK